MSYVESEEQQMLRQQVRQIGRKYGRDYYVEKAREGKSPDELWDEVAKQGFIGVNTPEEYGGGGFGMLDAVVILEEAGKRCAPIPLLSTLILGPMPIAELVPIVDRVASIGEGHDPHMGGVGERALDRRAPARSFGRRDVGRRRTAIRRLRGPEEHPHR